MKVLKHGIDVKAWRRKVICYGCNTELEIELSDIRYAGEAGDWHDSGWEKYWVNCSICDRELTLTSDDLPELIKIGAQKRKNGLISNILDAIK